MTCIGVIGGSGFIGSRLCELLAREGTPFRILDIAESLSFPEHRVYADVRETESLIAGLRGCDVIINLAAEHRDDVKPASLYEAVNVEGAVNVCNAAQAVGIERIIFTSTVAVYGFAEPNTDEEGKVNPFNEYGRTKASAERVFTSWQAAHSARRFLAIVRPTVVFGERNRGNVYNLLRQIASGVFVMIGNGKNVKSMAYVGNVSAFIIHMLSLPPGAYVSNYVDKPDLNMEKLVDLAKRELGRPSRSSPHIPVFLGMILGGIFDLVAGVSGRSFPISRIRVKKFCATTLFESAAPKFGFVAPYSIDEALARTINSEFVNPDDSQPLFYSE